MVNLRFKFVFPILKFCLGNEEFNEIQSHENLSSEDSDGEESDSDIRNEHAVNEFRLTAEEQKRMAELEAKMEVVLQMTATILLKSCFRLKTTLSDVNYRNCLKYK